MVLYLAVVLLKNNDAFFLFSGVLGDDRKWHFVHWNNCGNSTLEKKVNPADWRRQRTWRGSMIETGVRRQAVNRQSLDEERSSVASKSVPRLLGVPPDHQGSWRIKAAILSTRSGCNKPFLLINTAKCLTLAASTSHVAKAGFPTAAPTLILQGKPSERQKRNRQKVEKLSVST